MSDDAVMIIAPVFLFFAVIAALTIFLRMFVPARLVPWKQALTVVGLTYFAIVILLFFFLDTEMAIWGGVAGVPGAILTFWYWKRDYLRDWVVAKESPEDYLLVEDQRRADARIFAVVMVGAVVVQIFLEALRS